MPQVLPLSCLAAHLALAQLIVQEFFIFFPKPQLYLIKFAGNLLLFM